MATIRFEAGPSQLEVIIAELQAHNDMLVSFDLAESVDEQHSLNVTISEEQAAQMQAELPQVSACWWLAVSLRASQEHYQPQWWYTTRQLIVGGTRHTLYHQKTSPQN
jgi:hypothetical protein